MFFVFSYSTLLPLAMASAFGNYSSGIKIATEPQVFELPEGTTITLPCALEDHATNVTPRVVWVWSDGKHRSLWNDHHEYHGEDHHGLVKPQVIMEHDSKDYNLTINSTRFEDSGTFECRSPNKCYYNDYYTVQRWFCYYYDRPSSYYSIKHHLKITAPPRISGVIEKRLFISGNSASLKCNTTKGTEPVTFKWFLNDSLVTVSPNIDMKSDELRVANVSTYLSGTYRCLASNAYGEDEAFLNVNVVVAPRIEGNKSQNVRTLEGAEVVLKCDASGDPTPSVEWRVNNTVVTTEQRTLRIAEARRGDSANYTCSVTNKGGTDSVSYLLDVLIPPRILSGSAPERVVMAGDVFKLHCEASGYPEPSIRWTLNGDTLNATLNGHQHEFRNRAHTILAVHSAPSIDMLFECVAESEAGTVTKQFIVSTFNVSALSRMVSFDATLTKLCADDAVLSFGIGLNVVLWFTVLVTVIWRTHPRSRRFSHKKEDSVEMTPLNGSIQETYDT